MSELVVTTGIPYFPENEVRCKGTGVIKMDKRFADLLVETRHEWKKPLVPNSVCRTPSHNDKVGGHPSSLHLTENPKHKTNGTCAVDISWVNWSRQERLNFAKFCWKKGWSVGLHNSFIHLDLRTVAGLSQSTFLYGSWSGQFSPADVKS